MDPGSSCYIAIGLARKDYPRNRHPGWNKGSIAYHADDGKVFMGSGVGDPFGPRCNKGDIMGCGVLFPKDFECRSDSEEEGELMARIVKPSDNWEKTSGARALNTEKINTAFSDSSLYEVTPPAEKKNTETSTQEKRTEL